jgi:hypothetical protein
VNRWAVRCIGGGRELRDVQELAGAADPPWLASLALNADQDSAFLDVTVLPEGRAARPDQSLKAPTLTSQCEPVWGPDGRELFYRGVDKGQAVLASAGLRLTPEVSVLARRTLFPIDEMVGTTTHANYDIAPDGRTFVMVQQSPANRIMVIQNLPGLVSRMRGSNP